MKDYSHASEHVWWRTLSSGPLLSDSWFSLLLANRNGRLLRAWLLWLLSSFGTGRIVCKWHLCYGYFQMRCSSWFSAKNPKSSPAVLWVISDEKKKIPFSARISAKLNRSVISEPVAFSDCSFPSLSPGVSLYYHSSDWLHRHLSWKSQQKLMSHDCFFFPACSAHVNFNPFCLLWDLILLRWFLKVGVMVITNSLTEVCVIPPHSCMM